MTTPGTASNSTARKRNHPDPRCLVCGNGVPMDDALARARAEGAAEALAPVLALAERLRSESVEARDHGQPNALMSKRNAARSILRACTDLAPTTEGGTR
jgi:hypothetical protein